MTPGERLRWAIAPAEERSASLLWGGFAVFVAAGGLAALVELPGVIKALLYLVMVAGWVVGACGMVGYVRWYYGQSRDEIRKQLMQKPKD